ncbi:MAG: hypothetical protein LAO05_10620 [Acidobacteriia bacterium]|nr:hypothetical protein [Terriglobia bacterium]
MTGTACRWALAVAITLGSLVWQRVSGPTYPARGTVSIGGQRIAMTLQRSHGIASDQPITVRAPDAGVSGEVVWRRYPTSDPWQITELQREGQDLHTTLPKQPAAGKLEYQVRLRHGDEQAIFPRRPAITRFRGDVPPWILIPHITAMFLGLLFASRAGIEALASDGTPRRCARAALASFVVGGFMLGPAVQKFAFGEWWAGAPYGWDLTDNKTLLAVLAWILAVWALRGGRRARGTVLAAAIVTLGVFAIPHSAWGSQIDWAKIKQTTSDALRK